MLLLYHISYVKMENKTHFKGKTERNLELSSKVWSALSLPWWSSWWDRLCCGLWEPFQTAGFGPARLSPSDPPAGPPALKHHLWNPPARRQCSPHPKPRSSHKPCRSEGESVYIPKTATTSYSGIILLIYSLFSSLIKQNCRIFAGYSFSTVRTFCFSYCYFRVNWSIFWFWTKEAIKDVTFDSLL